ALYRQCAERRDKELRQRLQDSEQKLGLSMPLDQAKERATQLESEVTLLERYVRVKISNDIDKSVFSLAMTH
uniref:Uncharacterized protein LOC104231420 n=1 Tax=Nicotiana sylvestris TaxID=4096 RepID=A0A1U7X8E5_NICSY